METLNLSTQSTTEGNPIAFNRQYLTIFLGYIDPPFLIIGACTNVLTIIGIGVFEKFFHCKILNVINQQYSIILYSIISST